MLWIDRGVASLLIVLNIGLYVYATRFPAGADIFPKVVSATIIGLSALMLGKTFAHRDGKVRAPAPSLKDRLRPYLVFLCALGYIFFMEIVGFFTMTLMVGLLLIPVLEMKRRAFFLALWGGTMLFVYLLFVRLLNVPLPQGILY